MIRYGDVWSEDDRKILLDGINNDENYHELQSKLSSIRTYGAVKIQVQKMKRKILEANGIPIPCRGWSEDDDKILLEGYNNDVNVQQISSKLSTFRTEIFFPKSNMCMFMILL